jgi:predicted transcriptional regulator
MTEIVPNPPKGEAMRSEIMLSLLESVQRDGVQSQRRLAAELGIALGLVNAYLKRCVKKGLLKVGQAPARRYAYYLTPRGFAEKSRLSLEYLSTSLEFFRLARTDYAAVFDTAKTRGWTRVALAGVSDLAEISAICALEAGVEIIALVDADRAGKRHIGLPIVASYKELQDIDGIILTNFADTRRAYDAAVAHQGANRVIVPRLLQGALQLVEEAHQ